MYNICSKISYENDIIYIGKLRYKNDFQKLAKIYFILVTMLGRHFC